MALGMVLSVHAPVSWAQSGPSAADMESARALYQEGRQLRDQGNLPMALEKFKAAHALAGTPVTGIHLAQTHASLGNLVEARETCLSILRMPLKSDETERSEEARMEASRLATELEPRIPSLIVRVEGIEAGVTPRVTIAGQALPPAAVGLARKVNPGSQRIEASAPGYYPAGEDVSLRESESKELTLTLRKAPPGEVPPPVGMEPGPGVSVAPTPSSGGMSTMAVVGFIVAGSGVAVGSLSGLLAMQKASDLEGKCTDYQCPPQAHSDVDNGRMFGNVSTVAFGVAAVGLTVGVVGLLTQGEEPEQTRQGGVSPWVGMGSAGLTGVF